MSSTVSMWFRDKMLRAVILGEPLGFDEVWVAMTRVVPESNAPAENLDEPVGGGYGRMAYPIGPAATEFWEVSGYGEIMAIQDVLYDAPTAPWGLIQGWALCSAEVDGECLAVGSMVNPRRIDFGDRPVVHAYGITFGLLD